MPAKYMAHGLCLRSFGMYRRRVASRQVAVVIAPRIEKLATKQPAPLIKRLPCDRPSSVHRSHEIFSENARNFQLQHRHHHALIHERTAADLSERTEDYSVECPD